MARGNRLDGDRATDTRSWEHFSAAALQLECQTSRAEPQEQHRPAFYSIVFVSRPSPYALPDHLVRPIQQRLWNRHADLLRRLEIDHQLELRRLFHRQIRRFGSL